MDEETRNEETISLGGNIELSGFKEFDRATMVVVKKIVGNNTKKISTMAPNFEKITLHLKKIHGKSEKEKGLFELHAKLFIGRKQYIAQSNERNLFFALSDAFEKLEKQLQNK
jgi:ribosome-associated translation inhibitor RaiA